MDEQFKRLLLVMRTEEDKRKAINFLNGLIENLYKTDWSLKKFIADEGENTMCKAIIEILPDGWEKIEKGALEEKFSGIRQKIEAIKTIRLTLAIAPDDRLLTRIKGWANSNFGENYVLEIAVQQEIIGGAIVIVGGIYHDFSLSKKVDTLVADQKSEILDMPQEMGNSGINNPEAHSAGPA